MTPSQFVGQTNADRPINFVRAVNDSNMLSVWRECFNVEFFECRAALQNISKSNLLSVKGALVTIGLEQFESWYSSDADEVIFPIDDDDFFHPDLAALTENLNKKTDIVMWQHRNYCYNNDGFPYIGKVPFQVLLENNWGVRKSFLKRNFRDSEVRTMLAKHKTASLYCARALKIHTPKDSEPWYSFALSHESVGMLAGSYGLSLKHPASISVLVEVMQLENPSLYLRSLNLSHKADIPSDMEWATKWIRQAEMYLGDIQKN